MPSPTGANLINQINTYILNYAPAAFHNKALNNILLQLVAWIDSGGTTGPVTTPAVLIVTSANFTTAVDCPIPSYNGHTIAVLWCDIPKPLVQGVDFTPYAGGGFTMLTPGFNSGSGTFTFWVLLIS